MERANDPDRAAAIDTRFKARSSWLLLAVVALLRLPSPSVRGPLLALASAVFVALNVPTLRVLGRARRENLAFALWAPIFVALLIRSTAYTLAMVLAW